MSICDGNSSSGVALLVMIKLKVGLEVRKMSCAGIEPETLYFRENDGLELRLIRMSVDECREI